MSESNPDIYICVYITQMNITTELYTEYKNRLPQSGRHITAAMANGTLVVYQAFRPAIAEWAVAHQQFGGPHYSYNRMSWIKTSFLWMMYRSGWAQKEGQERILAITIKQTDFDTILETMAHATYKQDVYGDVAAWNDALKTKEGRIQWDPDHNPKGVPVERRAIQLGMKDDILKQFGTRYCQRIDDITPFVLSQYQHVVQGQLDNLIIPREDVYRPASEALCASLGLTTN